MADQQSYTLIVVSTVGLVTQMGRQLAESLRMAVHRGNARVVVEIVPAGP